MCIFRRSPNTKKIVFRIRPPWGGPSSVMCQGMLFYWLLHASPRRLINFLHLQCNRHVLVLLVLDTDTVQESTNASCVGSCRRCCSAAGGLSCWKAWPPAASGLQGVLCVLLCKAQTSPGPCAQARVCYLTWVSIPTVWPSIKPYVLTFQYLEIQSSGVPSLISWDQGQDLNVFVAA